MTLAALTTLAGAQVTPEQQSAIRASCRSDFTSKCSGVTPGGKEALQCLQKNVGSLSPACKTAVSAPIPAPAAPPPAAAAPPPPPPAAAAPAAKTTIAPPAKPAATPTVSQAAPKPPNVQKPTAPKPAAVTPPAPPPPPAPPALSRQEEDALVR